MLDPEAEVVCVGSSTYTHTLLTHTATAKSPAPHGALSANFRVYLVRKKKEEKKEFLAHYNYRLTSFEKEKKFKKNLPRLLLLKEHHLWCAQNWFFSTWGFGSEPQEGERMVGSCVGPIFL